MEGLFYYVHAVMNDGSKYLAAAFASELDLYEFLFYSPWLKHMSNEEKTEYIRKHYVISCTLSDGLSARLRGLQ